MVYINEIVKVEERQKRTAYWKGLNYQGMFTMPHHKRHSLAVNTLRQFCLCPAIDALLSFTPKESHRSACLNKFIIFYINKCTKRRQEILGLPWRSSYL